MKIKVPPTVVEWLVHPAARAVASTWRFSCVNRAAWDALVAADRGFACMLWHEALLPLLWHHRGARSVIVVSQARDGQYLSDFAEAIGYRLVRGSSSRGAVGALLAAVRELEGGAIVALTPDGPRGPRRELKPASWRRRSAPVCRCSPSTPRRIGRGGYIHGIASASRSHSPGFGWHMGRR